MTELTADKQCIFCLNFFPKLTEEHVIPDAIGGTLVIHSVCKDCNSYLGSRVDEHLVSNFLMRAKRFDRGLLGRRKNLKHPLSVGFSNELGASVEWHIGEGRPEELTLKTTRRQFIDETGDKQISVLLDKSNDSELGNILDKIEARELKKRYQLDRSSLVSEYNTTRNPTLSYKNEDDLIGIDQAILKIVYEMICENLGIDYAMSEDGRRLKRFIFNPEATKEDCGELYIRGQLGFLGSEHDMLAFIESDHLIALIGKPLHTVYVRILDFYIATIFIEEPLNSIHADLAAAEFIKFDTLNKKHASLSWDQIITKHT